MNETQKLAIIENITESENFPSIRKEAQKIFKTETVTDCFCYATEFYSANKFQVQELGVFILGLIADQKPEAQSFLKENVSEHPDWRVQEILAMAFDSFCKANGYENSLDIINEWINDKRPNVRRAVTEGLRIWTSRPYFKDNPEVAVSLLSSLRNDESNYVRKSVGNALRDISKKFPELIKTEILSWDISMKGTLQTYKLASKLVALQE